MNFKLDDDSLGKIIDIFDHIGEILNTDLYNYLYEDNNGITYFKTNVSHDTNFRKNKDKTTNTIPDERTKYNCRVLLQIQSVHYNNSNGIIKDEVFLQQCTYIFFGNNKLIHDVLDFTDTEPEIESNEEFNEDTI